MAQLQLQPATTGKKNRERKAQLKIDMTPMVDLGFLLITFFIFTTTMGEPAVTKLYMPADGDSSTLNKDFSLTVLLDGNDSVYYYHGVLDEALQKQQINGSNHDLKTGIGNIIREKQKHLGERKKELMLLIKPLETSSYSNLINTLDEVLINDVTKYAIVNATEGERNFVERE
jgi:biopolymer transport protein ExbD